MTLEIHQDIKNKLNYFNEKKCVPHILFHGPSGSGKRTIVNEFINTIYQNNREKIKSFVMYVNCSHGKGIKFIRDVLIFFAKTHINSNGGNIFKSIVLFNGDKLTMDAQSALRRCIELFSHNTRFFIVAENMNNLMLPILSRLTQIYVPEPIYDGKPVNLYKYIVDETFKIEEYKSSCQLWLKKELNKYLSKNLSNGSLMDLSSKLYEKGYSGLDIIFYIENNNFSHLSCQKKYEFLIAFNKVKKEFRNEKLLMLFILNFIYSDENYDLKNISFI